MRGPGTGLVRDLMRGLASQASPAGLASPSPASPAGPRGLISPAGSTVAHAAHHRPAQAPIPGQPALCPPPLPSAERSDGPFTLGFSFNNKDNAF